MAILTLLEYASSARLLASAIGIPLLALVVYRAYLHPLSAVPGPFVCRITSLSIYWRSYVGDECSYIDDLHRKHGSVIRIAPNEVCISDGSALAPIYAEKGGFLKAPAYRNFDFNGHATIFSAIDPAYRAVRSKAVLPLFSTASIRQKSDVVQHAVDRFVRRLKHEAHESSRAKKEMGLSKPVDVLNLSRSFALDAMSAYLFGEAYGGIAEETDKLSASGYVDAVVGSGRFVWLPNRAFRLIEKAQGWLWPDRIAQDSVAKVGAYVAGLVERTEQDQTYQAKLRAAGIPKDEVQTQLEDVIFAGTDSTGMNLASICWHLVRNPKVYARLRAEIKTSNESGDEGNSPGYLDAVIREGLRLAMANPVRLPRTVPRQGWRFTDKAGKVYAFPAGTQIGVQLFTLHTNPDVFRDPLAFTPERWLKSPTKEMLRDFQPFSSGQRQCIARNLAMQELSLAVRSLVSEDVLAGARPISDSIEILQWFNSRVVGERIDLVID